MMPDVDVIDDLHHACDTLAAVRRKLLLVKRIDQAAEDHGSVMHFDVKPLQPWIVSPCEEAANALLQIVVGWRTNLHGVHNSLLGAAVSAARILPSDPPWRHVAATCSLFMQAMILKQLAFQTQNREK
jgi:hypothetical protein